MTRLLLVVNVVAFLLSPVALAPLLGNADPQSACAQLAFFDRYAAEPAEVVSNDADDTVVTSEVGREGAQVGCVTRTPPPYDKQPFLSVLTAMFLHGGWLHLLGNMLFLLVFGNNVEDRLGRLRYLGFYLLCGYAATYVFALFFAGSSTPLVGASGAIAGVLGAYLVLFPRARVWSLLTFLFFLPVLFVVIMTPALIQVFGWG